MKAFYNTLTVIICIGIAVWLWLQYDEYKKREADPYDTQCPDPSNQYFDCDWWPKRR